MPFRDPGGGVPRSCTGRQTAGARENLSYVRRCMVEIGNHWKTVPQSMENAGGSRLEKQDAGRPHPRG